MWKQINKVLDENKEIYYQLLEDICNIESNSADFAGVRQVMRCICDFAQRRGFSIRCQEYENAGACAVIEMNLQAKLSPLMFSGHMDTVHKKGAFGFPPVHRDAEYMYGPGVADCKGGIVVALAAMDALRISGFRDRTIKLFLQCDEEVGSRYSAKQSLRWMIDEAQKCAAFLNCENARPGKITVYRKGILKQVIRVQGKAAHAKDYCDGASAVVEAAYKMIRFHEASVPGGLTFNCTIVPREMSTNTVPDICEFAIDIRVADMAQVNTAKEFVLKVVNECHIPGTSAQIIREGFRPPMEPCQKNEELFNKINQICAKYNLPAYEAFTSAGGADASNVSQAGVPCVDSMGIEGEAYHTIRERCRLASLQERAAVLAAVALEL